MDFLLTILSNIGTFLLAAWNWLTFNVDSPVAAVVISTLWGYLGVRAKPILGLLLFTVRAFKDAYLTDTEAAGLLWTLAAVLYGLLPTVHKGKILTLAPAHWHPVILEGKEPEFELVAVPKGRVAEVRGLLGSGG